MATLRQAINRVLIALGNGDDQVASAASSLTDNYHIKVAQWVNDVLMDVENAAQWRVLRTRDTATVSANGISGTFSSANERSRVFQVVDANRGELVPLVFDVSDGSAQVRLVEMDLAELLRRDQANSNAVQGSTGPTYFATEPTATGLNIYVYPRSSSAISIEADLVIPQSRMATTSAALLDTSIKVPELPVILGATWLCLDDRGEELGQRGVKAEARFTDALAGAVALENAAQGFDELVPV